MTRKLFYENAYLRETSATVINTQDDWIETDQTVFYPLGGGQPGDTGELVCDKGVYEIVDTRKGEVPDSIIHQLNSSDHGLSRGDSVRLSLDWDRRHAHMKMHTAMHLLGSLIPVPVTGGSVGAEKSRLDFDLGDHEIDKETLSRQINELIVGDHPIHLESISEETLDAQPELVRTMSVKPPRGAGTLRMVRVQDVDFQPCGGTHVAHTSEIEPLRVSKIENKGKRNRRVHLVWA